MQGSSPVGIIIWLLSLKVRTPVSQAGNDGFKSRRSYCGYRTVAVKRTQFAMQTVDLLTGAQDVRGTSVLRRPKRSVDRFPRSHYGWVCLAARAADCKSVTEKHRRFESCPIHFPFACPSGLWCLSVPLRSSQSGCPPPGHPATC